MRELLALASSLNSYDCHFSFLFNDTFQVFYVILTFYGPLPGALVIERSTDGGKTFQPWQYFAEDCVSSFMLPNNGPLTQPDSVNCIQYIK